MIKIDPKCIGVGQYQHDVNQTLLRRGLDREVEACVNSVGVDVNMASGSLLAHVAGIGPKLAERIVEHRDGHGRFENRERLLDVPKLGSKVFEQAAGFLRIRDGQQPLDNSAVHPESYRVVEKMAAKLGVPTSQLVGNATLAAKLDDREFVDEQFGLPTVEDILGELAKPGRDPRSEFKVARFAEGINNLEDLKARMILEGVITNNNQLKHADPLRFVAADVQGKHPCLLVAPQNPEGLWPGKSSQLAMEILDSLAEKYSIDADRRFVTGLSSGGMGTYYCLVERPDYFAAGAPICRRGDTSKTELIAKNPVWGFCGDKDDFAASMRAMNDAVKKAGGNWKYTEYPGVGHNSWGLAYATEDLQAWLFAQSRIKE